jgi:hypothetical protein
MSRGELIVVIVGAPVDRLTSADSRVQRSASKAPRENKFGEFIVVVQASRLHSPYWQAGRLHWGVEKSAAADWIRRRAATRFVAPRFQKGFPPLIRGGQGG